MTKQEFINNLTNNLLEQVSTLVGSSKEKQVQFLSEVQATVHSDKVKKVYRRRWFRDLPDPNEDPDLIESILILNRISWQNGLKWHKVIFDPLDQIQEDLLEGKDIDYINKTFVHTDRIVTYWLDKYVNECPENFKR
jgi:hypothetical protein